MTLPINYNGEESKELDFHLGDLIASPVGLLRATHTGIVRDKDDSHFMGVEEFRDYVCASNNHMGWLEIPPAVCKAVLALCECYKEIRWVVWNLNSAI